MGKRRKGELIMTAKHHVKQFGPTSGGLKGDYLRPRLLAYKENFEL